jgi:sensitive to high expression protein 9
MKSARQAAQAAKAAYGAAVLQRSNSQREVNDLLQRKSTWVDSDVSRFTALVRLDHSYEQEEMRTKTGVDNAEAAVEREFNELMRSILARYHEEQVWSDKIRSASTYGSLTVLGLNLVVFIMAIVVVEPWKRKRLAQTFEKKIDDMSVHNRVIVEQEMKKLGLQLLEQRMLMREITSRHRADGMDDGNPEPILSSGKVAKAARDREIRVAVVVSAVAASLLGWLARSWLAS